MIELIDLSQSHVWLYIPNTSKAQLLTVLRGAGGLGCEILKCLALSGFKDIHVIDMGMSRSVNSGSDFTLIVCTIQIPLTFRI